MVVPILSSPAHIWPSPLIGWVLTEASNVATEDTYANEDTYWHLQTPSEGMGFINPLVTEGCNRNLKSVIFNPI